jgi:hypothetical protein
MLRIKQFNYEYCEIDEIVSGCNHRSEVILIAPLEFASAQSFGTSFLEESCVYLLILESC